MLFGAVKYMQQDFRGAAGRNNNNMPGVTYRAAAHHSFHSHDYVYYTGGLCDYAVLILGGKKREKYKIKALTGLL